MNGGQKIILKKYIANKRDWKYNNRPALLACSYCCLIFVWLFSASFFFVHGLCRTINSHSISSNIFLHATSFSFVS